MKSGLHTIRFAAQHTGVSPHLIRAWERRYGALTPDRTATNRRVYSVEDLEKLRLLREAVNAGHSIGQIAALSASELRSMAKATDRAATGDPAPVPAARVPMSAADYARECTNAVARLDPEGLDGALRRAAVDLGLTLVIDRVLVPLLEGIGNRWREGELRTANEHMASAIVRTFLGRTLDSFQPREDAPILVVTTPAGQLHEIGALIAAVTAATEGWRILYLGANLPADDIAGAVRQTGARALALSVVHPTDDPRLEQELAAIRRVLGNDVPIFVGGHASLAYRTTLEAVGANHVEDMRAFRSSLEALRTG